MQDLSIEYLEKFSSIKYVFHNEINVRYDEHYITDTNNSSHPFGQMEAQAHMAQIGISAEPLTELSQQTPATFSSTSTAEPFVEFSKKMCENLFNFVSSFSQTQSQMVPNPSENFVPLSKLQQWYENFMRRIQQNPNFWRS